MKTAEIIEKAIEQIEDTIGVIDPGAIARYRNEKFKQEIDKA